MSEPKNEWRTKIVNGVFGLKPGSFLWSGTRGWLLVKEVYPSTDEVLVTKDESTKPSA